MTVPYSPLKAINMAGMPSATSMPAIFQPSQALMQTQAIPQAQVSISNKIGAFLKYRKRYTNFKDK